MKIVADLHIHSHYSRATSKNLTFEHLHRWAQLKGVNVVGTGDIAHPGWLQEMREKLLPAEEGLYRLKDELAREVQGTVPAACQAPVRFMLGGEISNIYKKDGLTRKVHNVVFAPNLDAVAALQARLERIGNIRSDGRPILGLDSRDLLETLLGVDPACHLIPAHIWTPWFSLLGSKSGFDRVDDCFGDLTSHIFAVETGLSSDPPMNWRVSQLDRYTLVSNSDAHSPEKLAREASLFDTDLSYEAMFEALRTGDLRTYLGTIEFFPEEGKYHLDGHRACGIVWDPATTLAHRGICPVCGKEVTIGVMHRVEELADRPAGGAPARTHPYTSLIPLPEVLGEVLGVGPGSGRVGTEMQKLLTRLGPELAILREVDLQDIVRAGGERLAEGIGRMRRGEVDAQAGYDGEYGVIRLFTGRSVSLPAGGQAGLFAGLEELPPSSPFENALGPVSDRAPSEGSLGPASDRAPSEGSLGPVSDRAPSEGSLGLASDRAPSEGSLGPVSDRAPSEGSLGPTSDRAPSEGSLRPVSDRAPSEGSLGPVSDRAPWLGHRPASADYPPDSPPDTAASGEAAAPDDGRPPFDTAQPSFFDLDSALEPETPNGSLAGFTLPVAALLGGLNEAQRQAVRCVDRSLVIAAGPGTGKTRTLTHRIAFLVLQHGVPPESILAITFTNKAAEEMAGRLFALLGPRASAITVKTFHAFAAGLLREHGAAIGPDSGRIDPDFVICSEEDRAVLLRLARPHLSPAELQAALGCISDAKNQLRRPEEVDINVRASYVAYEAALAASRALDFDDLIAKCVMLLETAPEVQAAVRARYQWISVDEYQDVNAAQVRLLGLLAQGGANLCVIGDPDQAIYGFRGADRRYFLAFLDQYPDATALQLSENYRSTQPILDAASQVIGQDGSAVQRPALRAVQALADFAEQVRLDVYHAPTDRAEAEYVVHQIEQLVGGTSYFSLDSGRAPGDLPAVARSFADFAVLYRLGAQSRLLIEAFDRSGIPYQTVGQAPLHARPEVRAVLAHLWLLHNPRSRLHLLAVVDGGKSSALAEVVDRILARLPAAGATTGSLAQALTLTAGEVGRAWSDRLAWLARLYGDLGGRLSVTRAIGRVWQYLQAERPGQDSTYIDQLLRLAGPFGERLSDFLQAALLRTETDAYDPRADRVTLMTLHAAKGLEFPVVFLVGCEEGLLPYMRKGETPDFDEERRLFYVGMTRAEQKLVLCHARKRVLFGQPMENRVSRFVDDIEAALKVLKEMEARRKEPKEEPGQLALF